MATKKSNPVVHWLTFSSLFQSEGESVTDFVVQLKSISPDCDSAAQVAMKIHKPFILKAN